MISEHQGKRRSVRLGCAERLYNDVILNACAPIFYQFERSTFYTSMRTFYTTTDSKYEHQNVDTSHTKGGRFFPNQKMIFLWIVTQLGNNKAPELARTAHSII